MKVERIAESRITPLCFPGPMGEENERYKDHFSHYKSITLTYRLLFCGIGIIFCLLGIICLVKTVNWSGNLLFSHPQAIRYSLCTLSYILAIWAFTIGIGMSPEEEACKSLFHKGKAKLKRSYLKKKIELELNKWMVFGERRTQKQVLKTCYNCSRHTLDENLEEALHKLQHLEKNTGFDLKKRGWLINKILHELHSNIDEEISSFNNSL